MDSWANGARGSEVKRVINNNFDILDKRTIKLNKIASYTGRLKKTNQMTTTKSKINKYKKACGMHVSSIHF